MSQLLIRAYLADLDRLKRTSGSRNESVVREAFKDLLKAWGRAAWGERADGGPRCSHEVGPAPTRGRSGLTILCKVIQLG